VQPHSGTVVRPGQTAGYIIWVWAAGRASNQTVVQIQATQAVGVSGPRFSACPSGSGTRCSVGSLPVNQSDELAASISVGSHAIGGERLVLTATVSAAGVRSASASAAIDVITPTPGDPSGKLTPPALQLGQLGGDVPPLPLLPGVTPVNPTSLFPPVSPGSGSGTRGPPAARRGPVKAVTTGAVASLTTLFGGEVLGLILLAGAIAIAFVRISLRRSHVGTPRDPSVRRS